MTTPPKTDCLNCNVPNCPIAHHCSNHWQHQINTTKTVVTYKKGQLIVKENTEAYGVYLIHSGKVIITSERENERRQIIRLAREGDMIEYIQHGLRLIHPFSAEAIEDCIICYIPKKQLFQLFNEENHLTYYLERRYAEMFVETEKRLRNAMIMNGKAKIADALLMIADAFDGKIPLLRKELGEMIGVSGEQVSREVRKLVREGIITLKGKQKEVVIRNRGELRQIVKRYDSQHQIE